MVQIHIEGILTEDGRLLPDHPIALSPGRVQITINPIEAPVTDSSVSLTREEARRRLAAAGKLGRPLPKNPYPLDNVKIPFELPVEAPGSEVLVDEDRGER